MGKPGSAKAIFITLGVVAVAMVSCMGALTSSERERELSPPGASSAGSSSATSPSSKRQPTEAENTAAYIDAVIKLDRKTALISLKNELLNECNRIDPHLNYIKVIDRKTPKGTALYCRHDFYGRYSLSSGDRAPRLTAWIQTYGQALRAHDVARIGVMGTGDSSSSAYFDLK